jgi:hypothetical protein
MDVGKSFTFVFEDKDWIAKVAIGGLIVLLSVFIIPLPLLVGYSLRVTKNVAEGNPTPLPEWNDMGGMFMQGLMAILGAIIWFAPVIVLACCLVAAVIGVGGFTNTDSDAAGGAAAAITICFQCLIAVASVLLSFFIYAPVTRFALSGQFETFWDFRGAWDFIKANPGNYVIAFLLALVANFIAGFGIIACFIGVFFTTFWSYLVTAHLFGQVARANAPPMDSTMLPPAPPMEPPGMMQGPYEPAPSA